MLRLKTDTPDISHETRVVPPGLLEGLGAIVDVVRFAFIPSPCTFASACISSSSPPNVLLLARTHTTGLCVRGRLRRKASVKVGYGSRPSQPATENLATILARPPRSAPAHAVPARRRFDFASES